MKIKTMTGVFLAVLSIGSVQAVDILGKYNLSQYEKDRISERKVKVKGEMKKIVFEAMVAAERDAYFSRTERDSKLQLLE